MPTPNLCRKMCEAPALKFFGDDTSPHGSVSGYLSTFNTWDRGKEMVLPGAFTKTLETTLRDGFLTIAHNWDILPIGTFTDLHEDDRGLAFTADFHSTQAAQDARTVAMERSARGKSVSTSIGYQVADSERTKEGLMLKDLPLYEGSLVNVPMNPLALVGGVKSITDPPSDEDDDRALLGLPVGLSFADETDAVRDAVTACVARAKAIADMRAKDGRVLSAANVSRLDGMRGSLREHADALDAMIALASPKSVPTPEQDEARRQLAMFLREQSRQLGVAV